MQSKAISKEIWRERQNKPNKLHYRSRKKEEIEPYLREIFPRLMTHNENTAWLPITAAESNSINYMEMEDIIGENVSTAIK